MNELHLSLIISLKKMLFRANSEKPKIAEFIDSFS